ncbi:MAG TPA: TfoX/Sxy family protein [Kribbellaceae bacterium]|nr:TfoX/Sxy family protein [Kribbellaceae bacterium]
MAYDEDLANRIREIVQDEPGLTQKRMFGGLAFLINGNMAVSASGQGGLLLRVDPTDTPTLVERPEASRFEMRGREMGRLATHRSDRVGHETPAQVVGVAGRQLCANAAGQVTPFQPTDVIICRAPRAVRI